MHVIRNAFISLLIATLMWAGLAYGLLLLLAE